MGLDNLTGYYKAVDEAENKVFESKKQEEALKLQIARSESHGDFLDNLTGYYKAVDEAKNKVFESKKQEEALKLQIARSKSNHKVLQSNFRTIRNRIKTIHENEQKS